MSLKLKKNERPSRITIDKRVFIRTREETEAAYNQKIAAEIQKFSFYNRCDLLFDFAKEQKLPKRFVPVYGKEARFHGVYSLAKRISRDNYPHWISGIFHRHSGMLKDFLDYRRTINTQILKGDAIDALSSLASLSEISESWWSIEMAIHINKELLNNDTKGYIKQLQEAHPHLGLAGITRDLLLLSESSGAQYYISTVQGRIVEFVSSAIDGARQRAASESVRLLPLMWDINRDLGLDSLYDLHTWSIFDQYILYQSVVMEMLVNGTLTTEWIARIQELSILTGDEEILNLICPPQTTAPFVENIISEYTHGQYTSVSEQVLNAVLKKSPEVFGLVEVYARAKVYNSSTDVETTYFDRLANEFGRILSLDPKSSDRLLYLQRICVKFRREPWAKSLLFHLTAIQEWQFDENFIERLRAQTCSLGKFNTPKAQYRNFGLDNVVSLDAAVPEHRLLKYRGESGINNTVPSDIFPIYSDYLKLQSSIFLSRGLMQKALDFSFEEYAKNSLAFGFLAIPDLCRKIEASIRDESFDYISGLIILDIYGKECDEIFDDLKAEIFEEYLELSDKFRPSMLFESTPIDSKTAYFLRNLCVPSQLDNIIQFTTNDEVIHERVAILDRLIDARSGSQEELRLEKDKVLETLFSEKLRAKIETGKLYVDVQTLETRRRHTYVSLFDQAKSLEGGIDLPPLQATDGKFDSSDLVQLEGESSVPVALASSQKSNILVQIFNQAVRDFALDENYGLDKYLSAEIRHIVFVTQLRSSFEKMQLVTSKKNETYLKNDFWTQKYNYVQPALIEQLNFFLADFSQEVDGILKKINERFRIKFVELSSDHVFDFCPYHRRIVRVSEIITKSSTFEVFMASMIGFMWELAVSSARSAQKLISEVLTTEILDAVDRLETNINNLRGDFAMLDVMQAIRDGRSSFKKEVELVLNWFGFVGSEDVQTFERLNVVVEAAVSSFQALFNHKGAELTFTQEKTELHLTYSESRSLFISLFTALENALRYCLADTPVALSHKTTNGVDEITIRNEIGSEIESPSVFVSKTKAKWTTAYSSLSTAEGGTGLYKIYNLLTNASEGFRFDITVEDNVFYAKIGLYHEYFSNRR